MPLFERRTWDIWKFALAAWGAGLVVAFASQLVTRGHVVAGTAWVLVPTAATALVAIMAVAASVMAVRRVDEYQLAASKFAWYWGGSLGLGFSVIGYSFIGLGGLHWLNPVRFHLGRDLFNAFAMGYGLGVGFPFAGFLIARLWWGLAHR